MTTNTPSNVETELRMSAQTKVNDMSNQNSSSSPIALQNLREDRNPPPSNMTDSPDYTLPSAAIYQPSISPPFAQRNVQTEAERQEQARREEEESIALARALMAEEAMAVSYNMSMDYLRHNRDQFSEEDLAALQAAMEEDEEEEQELEEGESEGMSYELMLRLGETLGDVKTERWSRVAKEKINALPTFKFDPKAALGKDENDCEVKCLVCQFQYEQGECLRRLPCNHCFHAECVDQWLMSKDCCPYCRTPIVEE